MTVGAVAARFMRPGLFAAFAVVAVPSAAPALGQQSPIPLRLVTADGTWDCKGDDGTAIGTVIIADSTYAFMNTDSKVDGYGKLHRVSEELVDLPNYLVIDGPLKDKSFVGTSMRGPAGDHENYARGIFLVLFDADHKITYCTRRATEGMLQ